MILNGKFLQLVNKKNICSWGGRIQVGKNVRFRTKAYSKINFGRYVIIYDNVGIFMEPDAAEFSIGSNSFINRRSEISCQSGVYIGNHFAISWDVTLTDTDYHQIGNNEYTKKIIIEDHVWIGCKSTILKGVTIGHHSVVAAGSVVTSDVPSRCIVAGSPARIIRENIEDWI